jgi:hypothetical protein
VRRWKRGVRTDREIGKDITGGGEKERKREREKKKTRE